MMHPQVIVPDSPRIRVPRLRTIGTSRSWGHPHMSATHDPWQDSSSSKPVLPVTAGLLAWYRADLLLTSSSGSISAWGNSSGGGDANKNALQGTGANQPTLTAADANYNNRPTVNFTGTLQRLVTGVWAVALPQPATVIIVGHTTSGAGNNTALDALTAVFQILDTFGTNVNVFMGNTLVSNVGTLNVPNFVWVGANGASSTIAKGTRTIHSTGNAGASGATGLTLGNQAGGGASWNGPIAEIMVYGRVLTNPGAGTEIDMLATYVTARYGVSIGA